MTLIFRIQPEPAHQNWSSVPVHDFYDWKDQQHSFQSLAAYYTGTVNLAGTEGPERYDGAFVTAAVFDALRVRPIVGNLSALATTAPAPL